MHESGSGSAPGATVVATVKWFDPVKGFGFLSPADGSRDVFCHVSAVSRAGWDTLPEGAGVTCEVVQGRQGPQVGLIHTVDASTASPGRAWSGGPPRVERGHGHGERGESSAHRVVAAVKWFVPSKGFGFLVPDDGSPDAFCHVSVVQEAGYDTLPQGANVTCMVTEGRRGPVVASILAVDVSTAPADSGGREERWRGRRNREWGRNDPDGAVEACFGFVKFFDMGKGYGFVVPDGGGRDVFLHGSVLNRAGLGAVDPGQRVSVMVEQGSRGPQATDIELA